MSLDIVLWSLYNVIAAAVIGVLIYRCLWRAFPVFFSLIVWDLIGNIGGYIVLRTHPSSYTSAYLFVAIGDTILLLGVLTELAWSTLRPVRTSLSRRALIPVIGLVLVVGAIVWPFASLTSLAGASGGKHYIVQLQQTVSILQIVFFIVLIAGSQLLSISWRDRELQIATGLGFFSFVDIASAVLQMHQTSYLQYRHLFRIEIGAYVCSLAYWVVCFMQQEAERRAVHSGDAAYSFVRGRRRARDPNRTHRAANGRVA